MFLLLAVAAGCRKERPGEQGPPRPAPDTTAVKSAPDSAEMAIADWPKGAPTCNADAPAERSSAKRIGTAADSVLLERSRTRLILPGDTNRVPANYVLEVLPQRHVFVRARPDKNFQKPVTLVIDYAWCSEATAPKYIIYRLNGSVWDPVGPAPGPYSAREKRQVSGLLDHLSDYAIGIP